MSEKKRDAAGGNSHPLKQYGQLFDIMSQGIVVHGDKGEIVYANPAASRILGLSMDQLLGRESTDPRWQAIHVDGSPFKAEAHPSSVVARTGSELRGTIMGVYNPDRDSTRWIEIDAFPLRDEAADALSVVYVVFSDITERMEAEKALRNSEEKYRLIFEHSPLGLLYFDARGIIRACNDLFVQIIGSTREKLVGLCMLNLPDQKLVAAVQKALDGKVGTYEDLYQSVTASKKTPVRAIFTSAQKDGQKSGGIGIIEDISEGKKTEEALRESEARLRTVSDNLPMGMVYQIDTGIAGEMRRFTYLSAGVQTLHNVSVASALEDARLIYDQVLEEDRQGLVAAEARALEEMKPFKAEIRNRMPDGRVLWRLLASAPRRAENGHLMWDGIEIDITDRKRAERISQNIIDNNPLSIQVVDRQGFTVTVNKAHSRLFGARPPADYSIFRDPQIERQGLSELLDRARNGEVVHFPEFQYNAHLVDPSFPYSPVWIRMVMFPLLDDFGQIERYVLMHENVSERKAAQDALSLSENRFRELVELAVDGILLGSNEGIVIAANRAFCEMCGLSASEILGRHISRLPFTEESVRAAPFRFDLIAEGQVVESQRVLRRPDGREVQVEMRSKMMPDGSYQSIFRDVSERIHSEAALRESTELFSLFMHHSPIYTFIKEVTPHQSRVLQVSDNFVDMIGMKAKDMIGKTMDQLFPADFAAKISADDWHVVKNEKVLKLDEELNGRFYTSFKFPIKMGGKTLLAGYTIDITERKQAEEAHVRLSDQLMQAQKMESVGRLAGGVAHDFNNMLGVIMGYTDMSLARLEAQHPLQKNLQEIRKAAERSANLTRQLLAFARKQTISPRVLDLNATVIGMLKMLERLIGEDIELIWLPGADLLPLQMDPSQVDQILANLCVNARDAVEKNGRISIETDNCHLEASRAALLSEGRAGEFVRLTVSDNGCGMDPDTLTHLFEPFYTTKETGKGTGLGLATVYGIVKQNEGFISVKSEPGKGSTIEVYFPAYRDLLANPLEPEPLMPREGRKGKVLLVEDEPAILEMTTMMLEELGCQVLAAADPEEALLLARAHPGRIDLLISDVVMPQMNGRELAAQLLEIHPELKQLFMSGYTEDVIAHHGVLDKGLRFIQKPFTLDDLAAKVAEVLDESRTV